jgi:hypothetical protein
MNVLPPLQISMTEFYSSAQAGVTGSLTLRLLPFARLGLVLAGFLRGGTP